MPLVYLLHMLLLSDSDQDCIFLNELTDFHIFPLHSVSKEILLQKCPNEKKKGGVLLMISEYLLHMYSKIDLNYLKRA